MVGTFYRVWLQSEFGIMGISKGSVNNKSEVCSFPNIDPGDPKCRTVLDFTPAEYQ
jgi:hypothetical protein